MKILTELTKDEFQTFLNEMFDFEGNVEYCGLKLESDNDGIEYLFKNDENKRVLSFSDPDLILWLYKNDVDISSPLKQLKFDYIELDESNSILFEYAMDINRIINDKFSVKQDIKDITIATAVKLALLQEKISKIEEIQRKLISKI